MKKKNLFITVFVCLCSMVASAQALKVSNSDIYLNLPSRLVPNNGATDGVQIRSNSATYNAGCDLLWLAYQNNQPNNPGILSVTSTSSGMYSAVFKIRANGNIGIWNSYPDVALVIGTSDNHQKVRINGNIVFGSDARTKENIQVIESPLSKLRQLKGVSYNFKDSEIPQSIPDKMKKSMSISEIEQMEHEMASIVKNKKSISKETHYGFLAQDVEKLFPELVYKDSADMMSVDYIGLIPVLVNALNEQQTQIDNQQKLIDYILKLNDKIGIIRENAISIDQLELVSEESENYTAAYLEQNIPNPFNGDTKIKFYLPETINMAYICIYDLQGKQLKQINISERGDSFITISGSQFNPGIYLYALIADGVEIDVKRMILTN